MFRHGNVIKEVSLKVKNLPEAIEFYNTILNLTPKVSGDEAVYDLVGSKLILKERETAVKEPMGSPGLYHIAFTVDVLGGLNSVLKKLLKHKYTLLGSANHGYTYAIYTYDPSGNGVEIYWDKPDYTGQLKTSVLPLESILSWTGEENYKISLGHIHLKVDSLEYAESFITNRLGMDVTYRGYIGALFFSYHGYHHHIGVNIWETYHLNTVKKPDMEYLGLEYVILEPPDDIDIPRNIYIDKYGNKYIIRTG